MTFALELRKPPCRVRERILGRELARHGIKATEEDTRSLAKEFDVTPGVASSAIAGASLCGGDLAAVRLGVRSLSRVISGEKPPANQGPPERFDPVLSPGRHQPGRLRGSHRKKRWQAFFPLSARSARHRQECISPLPSRTPRPSKSPKSGLPT